MVQQRWFSPSGLTTVVSPGYSSMSFLNKKTSLQVDEICHTTKDKERSRMVPLLWWMSLGRRTRASTRAKQRQLSCKRRRTFKWRSSVRTSSFLVNEHILNRVYNSLILSSVLIAHACYWKRLRSRYPHLHPRPGCGVIDEVNFFSR